MGKHPKVKPEVEARERSIADSQKKIDLLTHALDEALSIAAEFKPSGLPPLPASTAPAMISREKVSGMI